MGPESASGPELASGPESASGLESASGPESPATIPGTADAAIDQSPAESSSHGADSLGAIEGAAVPEINGNISATDQTSHSPPEIEEAPQGSVNHQPTEPPSGETTSASPPSAFVPAAGARPSPTPPAQNPKEWKSMLLQSKTLIPFIVLTIAAVGAIIALTIVSRFSNGIASVRSSAFTIANISIGLEFLWTSIPVFLFNLYNVWFKAVVTACADRQPYVELYRQNDGASFEQSVLLDYRAYWAIKRPWIAKQRKHPLLLIGFIFSSALTIAVSSLAAHLFAANIVVKTFPRQVPQDTAFNQSSFGARSDLAPIFDVVLGTLVFGGTFPAWTTSKYCLERFPSPTIPEATRGTSNFTVEISAYSANLSCVILNQSQYTLNFSGGETEWIFTAEDRGCSLSTPLFSAESGIQRFSFYVGTFANIACSLEAGLSRLVVVTAHSPYSNLNILTDVTALSCETAYWNLSGSLTVSVDVAQSSSPAIVGYTEKNGTLITDPRPQFWKNFEAQLHEPSIIDDTGVTSASDFGYLVLEYAKYLDSVNFLDSSIIQNATESIFTAVYAVMCTSFLIQPGPDIELAGELLVPTNRLLIVAPIAYTIVGILCAFVLYAVLTYFYVETHRSILYEEPIGLAGAATLLSESPLLQDVILARKSTYSGEVCKKLLGGEDEYWKTWRTKGWRVEGWDHPPTSRIIEDSVQLPTWKASIQKNFTS
jgi:Protein of unknown function (DUF3433)